MGGLIEFLSASGGNSDTTAETLTEGILDDLFELAFDDGGNPNLLVCNQKQMKVISGFNADKIRVAPGAQSAGVFVTNYMTKLGAELEILVDRWVPDDTILLLDTARIKAVPLKQRGFGMKPIAATGDAEKMQILGDYTLEVRNALEAHAIHTNLASS
jgi:hypothetical protein